MAQPVNREAKIANIHKIPKKVASTSASAKSTIGYRNI